MKYKAIIFDMDGTIVDTEPIWDTATYRIIQRRGVQLSADQKIQLDTQRAGLSMYDTCALIKMVAQLADNVIDLMREKIEIALALHDEHVAFMDGFLEFHALTKTKKLKSAIATNAETELVDRIDKKLNLQNLFGQHIYCVSHVRNAKPHPELYLHAADKLGIDPKECIAIEDSAHGIQAAKDAGMFCIAYNSSKKPALLKQAHVIVDAYHEIDLDAW